MRDQAPGILGNIPFGLITGAAATSAGLDPWLAMGMSVLVFAGASQLAAISLMAQSAPAWIVILTVAVVNLRMMMYSAAIAPYFRHSSGPRRWLFAYLMTDHAFALVTTKFKPDELPAEMDMYYLGAALFMWVVWQIGVAVGVFAGTLVPANWSLEFAIPLVFLSLVLPALTTRNHWTVAICAGAAAAFCASLPLKMGLLAGAVTGVVVGITLDHFFPRAGQSSGGAAT
jgi:4-azaleucine resistance transporter AzlC